MSFLFSQMSEAELQSQLRKLYVEDKLSIREIAEKWGVSNSTIFNHLRRLGIKTRSKGKTPGSGLRWKRRGISVKMKNLLSRLFKKETVKDVQNVVPEVEIEEIAEEWLPFSIEELYWEIRAEEEETEQVFQTIMKRRFEEAGVQPGTTMWDDAEEGIREVNADVAIGYAESVGLEGGIQWAEEWEQRQINAAIVRMICRELEQRTCLGPDDR